MDKLNPLVPFAFNTSSFKEKNALNTTPRERDLIDENAGSMYHTRTPESRRKGPTLNFAPTLKRKMGASFNEKDDIKRREMEDDYDDSEPTFVDESIGDDLPEGETPKKTQIPPSSPLVDNYLPSETEFDNINIKYRVDSPSPDISSFISNQSDPFHRKEGFPDKVNLIKSEDQPSNLSSEIDFGIDRFNRFKQHQLISSEEDNLGSQNVSQNIAREKIIDAFENMRTIINLESMHLKEIPEEIKDMNNLVIFNPEPKTKISYQLYLTNNNLRILPPSLFKFTKLDVLGIRQNPLEEIPPLINNLQNLSDLALGTNKLRYLPPEILDLSNLETFSTGPNPFYNIPYDAIPITSATMNSYKMIKCVSPVKYLGNSKCKIPSLKILTLNTISQYDVSYLETKQWKKSTPKIFHDLIAKAIINGKFHYKCSECAHFIVEPFAETFEWWDILQNKDIPIRKQFCCGICVRKWESKILELKEDV